MRMSLQYQFMLDMEKEKSQTALFKKIFDKTTAAVCISRQALKEKK